ncbi:MAG: hypothetical protein KDD47_00370, partial [Acidobacteria bacterium]|nr:hypothetical protein [Acidobacteriota bacterium]
RRIAALDAGGADASGLVGELLARQGADGGWGADAELASDPLDTALALLALVSRSELSPVARAAAAAYLISVQGTDGSWGPSPGAGGRSTVTALAARALATASEAAAGDPSVSAAVAWLAGKQDGTDGGFGDSPSTSHDTAQVLRALADLGALEAVDTAAAELFLRGRQDEAGSWEGSTYATAVAVAALERLQSANFVLPGPLLAEPASPRDGERVRLQATVTNDAGVTSPATTVRFFDGDPSAGGTPVGADAPVPPLAPGQAVAVDTFWDTFDAAGSHQVFAVVDPDGLVQEVREGDNSASLVVEVQPAPAGVEVEIRAEEVSVSPASPDRLPVELTFLAVVRNFGRTDAVDLPVRLWRGEPGTGTLVAEVVLPLLAQRSSLPLNFLDTLTEPGSQLYILEAVLDPPDEDPTNDRAAVTVTPQPSIDLEVLAAELSVSPDPAFLGADAQVTATLHNRGTLPAPSFTVRTTVSDGVETVVVREVAESIPAGGSVVLTFPWRVDRTGELTLEVLLDPENLILEPEEGNNTAALAFTASQITDPNLTLSLADLTFTPEPALEAAALELGIVVRNTGGVALDGVRLAFFDGDASAGGALIADTVLDGLAAGEARPVSLTWPSVPSAADRLVFAAVDPDDTIAELDEGDNQVFRQLTVLSLPDLVLSAGALDVQPPLPSPGETVTLSATVANLGEQGSGPFVVRAFAGDPADGVQLGGDQVLTLPSLGDGTAVFSFTLPVETTGATLTVVADADGAVLEGNETNNRASRDLTFQSGDFFVSERYFSPNGDGAQDTTRFTYRLDGSQVPTVLVVGEEGETVRTEVGTTVVTEGAFLWDGRDDRGRVVGDGDYRLEVLAADGTVLGAAFATVDLNRSPLELAFGTPFGRLANLTCQLPEAFAYDLAADEGSVVMGSLLSTPEFRRGLYRVPLDRPVPQTLAADVVVTAVALSPDGSRVAWRQNTAPSGIWSADAAGLGAVRVAGTGSLVGISADGRRVLVADGFPSVVRSTASDGSGGDQTVLALSNSFEGAVQSPDHRHLLILDGLGVAQPWLVDLTAGSAQVLTPFLDVLAPPVFSPDSSQVAVADSSAGRLWVFGTDGSPLVDLTFPGDAYPRELFTPEQAALASDPWGPDLWDVVSLDWSPLGDSLAALVRYGDPFCEGYWRLFQVDATSGEVTGLAWSEASVVADPDIDCSGGGDGLTGGGAEALVAGGLRSVPFAAAMDPAGSGLEALAAGDHLGERTLLPAPGNVLFWSPPKRVLVGPWAVDVPREAADTAGSGGIVRFFEEFTDFHPERLLPSGRGLLFRSTDATQDGSSPCFARGDSDLFSFRSLLNLTAELQPRATADGSGFLLEGTAADLHFGTYQLEWSSVEAPDSFHPVAPPAIQPVVAGRLGLWIPPAPGAYFLRLTVRDLAGNQRQALRQVTSATAPTLANLFLTPEVFSTNPGARLDRVEIHYDVLAP